MRTFLTIIILWTLSMFLTADPAFAQRGRRGGSSVYFSPFVSTSSATRIEASRVGQTRSTETETSTTIQRTVFGVNAGISFWRVLSLQVGVGRSQLDRTTRVENAVDDFGAIDFERDLDMSTEDPLSEVRQQEIWDRARLTMIFDPGFWIFIARAKVGVQANRREMSLTQNEVTTKTVLPISYSPLAGAGLGVRIGRTMRAMAEYNFIMHQFPLIEPFEREVLISYSISL